VPVDLLIVGQVFRAVIGRGKVGLCSFESFIYDFACVTKYANRAVDDFRHFAAWLHGAGSLQIDPRHLYLVNNPSST